MSTIDVCLPPSVAVELSSERTAARAPGRNNQVAGVCIGELVAIQDGLVPLVVFRGQPGTAAMPARATIALSAPDIGRQVVLSFIGSELDEPVVIGRLVDVGARPLDDAASNVEVDADGRTVIVSAKDEIVLRCGKASVTLTSAGKVLIRGTYLLSRSSGVNAIKGGTVEIN